MMDEALNFRPMEPRETDLSAFQECFARNGTNRRIDALRWQYFDNPTGELLVDLAVSADRIASIYAVQPASARVQGVRRLAAQSVDTLVDADFRGRGLFTKTADTLYRRTKGRGAAFVYGFPNANSAPGFFKKLGWVSLDPVPFLVKPLRSGYFASRFPLLRWFPDLQLPLRRARLESAYAFVPLDSFGTELEALWDRFAANVVVAVDRSADYFRWRFNKPGERYDCLGLFDGDALVAFCAYTTVQKHGGRIGYVLELLHEPDRPDLGAVLLRECVSQMASDRADAVLAWAFDHAPNATAYKKTGFLRLPERLRPIELHFGFRPLDESLKEVLSDRRNWYISYCDSDTV